MLHNDFSRHSLACLLVAFCLSCLGCTSNNGKLGQGNALEKAFLQAMVPHHAMAIDMAEMCADRSLVADIETMATAIITAQSAEIMQLQAIHLRLFGAALVPDAMAHSALGLTMEEAGMDMDMGLLMDADPFDREFIDMMIPHHQGAIRMANVLLENSSDSELRTLANAIITAQTAEIAELTAIRNTNYPPPV